MGTVAFITTVSHMTSAVLMQVFSHLGASVQVMIVLLVLAQITLNVNRMIIKRTDICNNYSLYVL